MKKELKIILLLVFIGLLVFVFISSNNTDVPVDESRADGRVEVDEMIGGRSIIETVESPDGRGKIEIAEGSLPDGVQASDLSMNLVESDNDDEIYYELLPAGTQFDAPVRVTIDSEVVEGNDYDIPLLLHVYEEEGETVMKPIETITMQIDSENNTTALSGDISHFSGVVKQKKRGAFTISVDTGGVEHDVGESFNVEGIITPTGEKTSRRYIMRRSEFMYAPGSTWGAKGSLETYYKNVLKPWTTEVLDRRGLTIHQQFKFSETFSCEEEGYDKVSDKSGIGGLRVKYKVLEKKQALWHNEWEDRESETHTQTVDIRFSQRIECVEPEDVLQCRGVQAVPRNSGKKVSVFGLVDGYCYESSQFDHPEPAEEDGCDFTHYHTTLRSVDGSQTRVDSGDCGAATESDITGRGVVWMAVD